jgi:hypothetical protein
MDSPIATIERGGCRADIYEQPLPGDYLVVFRDASGQKLEESALTGISTYRQRESEITDRLEQLCSGRAVAPPEDFEDSGEY